MKAAIEEALAQLVDGGPGDGVQFEEDESGGAFVLIDDVSVGSAFAPTRTWIAFHITNLYPESDVYPLFTDAALQYVGDGATPSQHPDGNLPERMTRGNFTILGLDGIPAIQISRSSPRRNSETDSALNKLLRVINWMEQR
jgi:hypothetical protein